MTRPRAPRCTDSRSPALSLPHEDRTPSTAADEIALSAALGSAIDATLEPHDPAWLQLAEWLAAEERRVPVADSPLTEIDGGAFAARVLQRAATRRRVAATPSDVARRSDDAHGQHRIVLARACAASAHRTGPAARGAGVSAGVSVDGQVAPTPDSAPLGTLAIAAGEGRSLWDEPVESWVAIPPGLPRGQYVAFPVRGESMRPLIASGDIILVRLTASLIRHRVVVARRPDETYIVKQVGRITRSTVELRSLNAAFPPIILDRHPDTIIGTVELCWHQGEDPAAEGLLA